MVAATNFYKSRALKTAQIYSVTVLEVRSPKVVSLDSSPDVNNGGFFRLLGNNLLIYLFHLLRDPCIPWLAPPSSIFRMHLSDFCFHLDIVFSDSSCITLLLRTHVSTLNPSEIQENLPSLRFLT